MHARRIKHVMLTRQQIIDTIKMVFDGYVSEYGGVAEIEGTCMDPGQMERQFAADDKLLAEILTWIKDEQTPTKFIGKAVECWHDVADEHDFPHCNCFRDMLTRRLRDAP